MGLFSSKYVTNVATTVSRVVEDHALPDSIKHGAVKGLFSDDDQLIENILEELVSSVGMRAGRLYRYGRDHYQFGLPSGAIHESEAGAGVVQAKIAELVGQAVTLDYYHYGALNNLHLGWVKLISDYGYNAVSNVLGNLTTAKGVPVYLTDIAVVVTEASLMELNNGSLDQWGNTPSSGNPGNDDLQFDAVYSRLLQFKKPKLFELDTAAPNDYLRVEYSWTTNEPVTVEGVAITRKVTHNDSFRIQITGFDEQADWHQARYKRADGQVGYFLYNASDLLYPEIDALHNPAHQNNGSYFPFGYFRWNKVSGNADKNAPAYKQSKKLFDYVGIDYDSVTDAIHQNPGIDQVESAMMMMAVPAVTTDQTEMRYLFDYFSTLYDLTDGQLKPPEQGQGIADLLDSSRNDTAIVIQDARFKMALGFRRIYKRQVPDNIGKIGTMASGNGTEIVTEMGSATGTGAPVSWNTIVKGHWYKRQVTETMCEEIKVENLKMVYYVYGEYTAVGEDNSDILLVPIDRSIADTYSLPVRETLYTRSLHYIFNSRVVTEIKWYQTGVFRAILLIAAIIITIWSYGLTWESITLFLATHSVEQIIYLIAIKVLEYVVVTAAVHLFIKVVGVKIAFIAAVMLALAGSYQAIEAGSIEGAPMAAELLQLSTGISKGINTELKREFGQFQQEAQDFELFVKSEEEKLKAKQEELLNTTEWLTPTIIFGEKPNDYYQRTVHSGNIGILSVDAIAAFVDIQLQLPKLTDTL